MGSRRSLAWFTVAALSLGLSSCGDAPPVDVAQFSSSATLSDAIDRASVAYGVPREVLVAVTWAETRFGDPSASGEHHAQGERDDAHAPPEVGPLHLRGALVTTRGASVDTLARASALTGLDPAALRANTGYAVAGAAAALAELGRQTGARADDLASWAEAVARWSSQPERPLQVDYAAQVFTAIREGVSGMSFTGEAIGVDAHPSLPDAEAVLGLNQAAQHSADYGPALWSAASSSNYTNGRSGARVQYVVIHTMQGSYSGSISWFRNPSAGASAHYMVRSSDGQVTQMVDEDNTAWHAGNWNINTKSVGIEHEGYVADPGRWYTEAMYRASARLTRALCDRYHIPIDRSHIIGHYQVPRSGTGAPCGTTATNCGGAGGHTDPGNGGTQWNWNHFMDLVRSNGEPTPTTPAYAATLVGVSCPATATSGDRPVAYVEYRNTGTATWQIASTRVGTTNPRDHNGIFYDSVNWVSRNRPSGVDHATAPGAVGRFSFVIGIPDVTSVQTISENYGLLQEGVTWFGPSDTAVRCAVRVSPRPGTVVDAGAPRDAGPADTGVRPDSGAPRDAGPTDTGPSQDAGAPEDVGEPPVEEDSGVPTEVDAGDPPIDDAGGGFEGDDAGDPSAPELTSMPEDTGCGCTVPGTRSTDPVGARFSALALGAAARVARRRRRRSRQPKVTRTVPSPATNRSQAAP